MLGGRVALTISQGTILKCWCPIWSEWKLCQVSLFFLLILMHSMQNKQVFSTCHQSHCTSHICNAEEWIKFRHPVPIGKPPRAYRGGTMSNASSRQYHNWWLLDCAGSWYCWNSMKISHSLSSFRPAAWRFWTNYMRRKWSRNLDGLRGKSLFASSTTAPPWLWNTVVINILPAWLCIDTSPCMCLTITFCNVLTWFKHRQLRCFPHIQNRLTVSCYHLFSIEHRCAL